MGFFNRSLLKKKSNQVFVEDLYVTLFGQNILIKSKLAGIKPSKLSPEDFPDGILPNSVVDVVEIEQTLTGVATPTKYYIEKSGEYYFISTVGPVYNGTRLEKIVTYIDIIGKRQFNTQKFVGKYDLGVFLRSDKNYTEYEYYEDSKYNRIWHGKFFYKEDKSLKNYNNIVIDTISGNFKHDYRDGEWYFKGRIPSYLTDNLFTFFSQIDNDLTKDSQFRCNVTYLLGKIVKLKFEILAKTTNKYKTVLNLQYDFNGNIKSIYIPSYQLKDGTMIMSNGMLDGRILKERFEVEEIWEFENGIQKSYIARSKSTGEIKYKNILTSEEFEYYKKIVDLNDKNLPERLDYPVKPVKSSEEYAQSVCGYIDPKLNPYRYTTDYATQEWGIWHKDIYDLLCRFLFTGCFLEQEIIKGDLTVRSNKIGYFYKFEKQQTRAELAEIERQKKEAERLERERIERERLAELERQRLERERLAELELQRLEKIEEEKRLAEYNNLLSQLASTRKQVIELYIVDDKLKMLGNGLLDASLGTETNNKPQKTKKKNIYNPYIKVYDDYIRRLNLLKLTGTKIFITKKMIDLNKIMIYLINQKTKELEMSFKNVESVDEMIKIFEAVSTQ